MPLQDSQLIFPTAAENEKPDLAVAFLLATDCALSSSSVHELRPFQQGLIGPAFVAGWNLADDLQRGDAGLRDGLCNRHGDYTTASFERKREDGRALIAKPVVFNAARRPVSRLFRLWSLKGVSFHQEKLSLVQLAKGIKAGWIRTFVKHETPLATRRTDCVNAGLCT